MGERDRERERERERREKRCDLPRDKNRKTDMDRVNKTETDR